jgi:hypothetical protein
MENTIKIKTLLISGDTLQEWNVDEILTNEKSKNQDIETLVRYEWDNTIGKYCNGMTYLEIEQLDYKYNY